MKNNVVFIMNFIPSKINDKWTQKRKEKYVENKAFYSFKGDYNVETYFANKTKCKEVLKSDYTMENYYSNDEKTKDKVFGKNIPPFNNKKFYTQEELEEVKNIFKNTKGNIWHGVISFDEKTTKEKIKTGEDALHFLNRNFNQLIESSHLNKDNICLYAVLHTNTDNHHIHFAFCEKEPIYRTRDGKSVYREKGMFNKTAIENFLVSSMFSLTDEKEKIGMKREEILKAIKEKNKNEVQDFKDKVIEIYKKLPKEGRLSYQSENIKEVKKDIDNFTKFLFEKDEELNILNDNLNFLLNKQEKEIKERVERKEVIFTQKEREKDEDIKNKDKEYLSLKRVEKEITKRKLDIQNRIKNSIIKFVLNIGKNLEQEEEIKTKNKKQYIYLNDLKEKNEKIYINREREKLKRELIKLFSSEKNIKMNFEKTLDIASYEIQNEQEEKEKLIESLKE